jgi:hypothetical protein
MNAPTESRGIETDDGSFRMRFLCTILVMTMCCGKVAYFRFSFFG